MAFISVPYDRRFIRVKLEKIIENQQIEQYKVIGRNKALILQSNRPLLRNKGVKYRKPNWKVINGKLENLAFLEILINTIESYLKREERGSSWRT